MKKIIAFVSFCLFITPQIFAQTIATGSITTPICAGASISVPYTITGTFTAGNIFTAQLSSATGLFTTPVNIGSLASVASGTITAMIPPTTVAGTAYRIRVVSNTPVITGTQNAAAITINTIAVNPAVSISSNLPVSNLCANSSITFTASLTNGGTSPVYQWYKNSVAVGTSSSSYTNNLWNNGDSIWCKTTGRLTCALNSGASSNYIVVATEITTNNSWRQKADIGFAQSNAISARRGAVAFSIGQKGYAGLGYTGLTTLKDFWEFDPTTNAWTQKANFGGTQRENGVGFSIGNKGYIGTGGNNLTDFWEFDPVANLWTAKANFPGTGRTNAVGFSIGNKGYLGTGLSGTTKLSDFWEYDPSLNSWVQKANFGGGLRYSAVGFSIGNKGYIGTGTDGTANKNDFWEFDPSKNSWTQKANFGGSIRQSAAGFSIGNVGFIGTGRSTAYLNDFWLYNPVSNTWLQKSNVGSTGRMLAFSFSVGNKGYIGSGNSNEYLSNILSFDTTQNTWTSTNAFNGNARAEAVSFSIGNNGYLGTGFDGVNYKADFWQYDQLNNAWTQKADLTGGARKGAVGFAIGNKGYVGTGRNGTADFDDFWQYNPSTNSWIQKTNFPSFARSGAVGFVVGSKGYIGTGYRLTNTTYCKDFWAYDTLAQSWTAQTDFPGLARSEAVAFTLSNKAYVGTGFAGYPLEDFWEFNPSSNLWEKKSTFAKAARYNAVAFSIGSKGYLTTGFYEERNNSNQIFYNDNWEYDATLNRWSQLTALSSARYEATAFTIGNFAYIGTGKRANSTTNYLSDLWEFSTIPSISISTSQTSINSADSCTTNSLLFSAKAHDYVVNPSYQWYKNNTAVATGINYTYSPLVYGDSIKCTMNSTTTCSVNSSLNSNVIAIDNFANNSSVISNWKQIPNIGFNAVDGPNPRCGAVGFSIGNYGYIGTGIVGLSQQEYGGSNALYLDDFWQYDPSSNSWTQKARFSGGERGYAVSFVLGQKGYVGTGTDGIYSKNDLWEYDPSTNQWLPKSNLPASPRYGAIAFTIDGLGYVGTGYGTVNGRASDFWQYNSSTDTWLQKANFGGGSIDFATSFSIGSNGYVTGGFGDFWAYSPTTNVWTSKASLPGTAVTKALGFSLSGKGYVCFGSYGAGVAYNDKFSSGSVREYDPILNTWSFPLSDTSIRSRPESRESAVGFTIGNNAYLGTGLLYEDYIFGPTLVQSEKVFNDLWKFNPTSTSSSDKIVEQAKMGGRLRELACSFTIKNKGYVIGGRLGNRNTNFYQSFFYKDVWQFDPVLNIWTQKANFPGTTTHYGIGFATENKGYYGLGSYSGAGNSNTDFWEYDPETNSWVKKANFPGVARAGAVSFSIGSKGYIGTGGNYLQDFWEYNPSGNSWMQLANFGGVARFGAVGFSLNGKGYIGTGRSSTGYLNDFWEYNPSTNAWVQKANFGGAARSEATGFAIGGKGYIGTGSSTSSDFWAYQPETNVWTVMETVPFERRSNAVSFVAGEKAYVGTGRGTYTELSDFWEFNPNTIRLKLKPIDTVFCTGNTFQLSYTIGCISPKNGNVFTAQLSDSLGSFQNPTSIGTVSSTGSGTISANLSSNVASGSGYRIRIVSSNPVFVSADNGQNIQIKKAVGEKLNVSNCSSYVWRGDTLRQSGTFYKLNSLLCNATDTLNLTILPSFRDTTNVFICADQFPYSWRGQQYQQYGIYSVTFTNQYNCDSIYYLKLSPGNQCQANLTILGFLEGFTESNGEMTPTLYNLGISTDPTATDTIQIELWSPNALSSALPTFTTKTVLKSNGTAFTPLPTNIAGQVFYIAIKHRNSIEVWSAHPILFSENVVYDFKSSVDSAFTDGFNPPLRNIGMGKNALFSGDVNQDGTIDIFDTQLIENEASAFQFGYNPGDVNGDMSSDIFDLQVVENNSVLFIYKARPF